MVEIQRLIEQYKLKSPNVFREEIVDNIYDLLLELGVEDW